MYKDDNSVEVKSRRMRQIFYILSSLVVTCYFDGVAQGGRCVVGILLEMNEDHFFHAKVELWYGLKHEERDFGIIVPCKLCFLLGY